MQAFWGGFKVDIRLKMGLWGVLGGLGAACRGRSGGVTYHISWPFSGPANDRLRRCRAALAALMSLSHSGVAGGQLGHSASKSSNKQANVIAWAGAIGPGRGGGGLRLGLAVAVVAITLAFYHVARCVVKRYRPGRGGRARGRRRDLAFTEQMFCRPCENYHKLVLKQGVTALENWPPPAESLQPGRGGAGEMARIILPTTL